MGTSCPRHPEKRTQCWGPKKLQRSAGAWRGVTHGGTEADRLGRGTVTSPSEAEGVLSQREQTQQRHRQRVSLTVPRAMMSGPEQQGDQGVRSQGLGSCCLSSHHAGRLGSPGPGGASVSPFIAQVIEQDGF